MKRILNLALILFIIISTNFGYISRYLELDKNSLEYNFIRNPSSFEIAKSVLVSYGITTSKEISLYSSIINQTASDIENKFNKKSKIEFAKFIFQYMHDNILKKYSEHAYRLDTLLDSGDYNCISSTIFYNILLIKKGYNPQMVLTRDHTFTILNIDGNDIFIENTSEAGFNYINNPHLINREELVSRLQKDKHIVLNQKEMILSIYANRIYYINGPEKAFQISLKALALDPESIAKYNNIQAGFFNYLQYLTKNEKNYEKSYSITQEAVESLKSYPFLLNRYKIDVNNYLILLVENQDFEKALTILQNSSEYISDIDFINEMNFYININYGNFYFSNQNYEKAYSKFMISYEINSRNSTINKNLNSTFIMWAQQNFKNDNYTKAEEIINKGLEIFPESPPLNKMRNYLNKIDY
ncbi:MAG: hypothetical protein FXF47_02870 [Candidatus Mcinerneyibacterium aminivorans]|uniref:Tetratricopeptide repeat protein n=1 Tax=Candidatus Mcinerneyibacterium aminivorans TaxID=2703815 RepID=A0A5D0MGL6_9BACT|nr:MAG: hypothetical protein FXF47_02870 [Candidatus Mcinerneyibacterium aminivorans]